MSDLENYTLEKIVQMMREGTLSNPLYPVHLRVLAREDDDLYKRLCRIVEEGYEKGTLRYEFQLQSPFTAKVLFTTENFNDLSALGDTFFDEESGAEFEILHDNIKLCFMLNEPG